MKGGKALFTIALKVWFLVWFVFWFFLFFRVTLLEALLRSDFINIFLLIFARVQWLQEVAVSVIYLFYNYWLYLLFYLVS